VLVFRVDTSQVGSGKPGDQIGQLRRGVAEADSSLDAVELFVGTPDRVECEHIREPAGKIINAGGWPLRELRPLPRHRRCCIVATAGES